MHPAPSKPSTDQLPLVSVVIPAYNRQAFIGDCLARLFQQTYRNLEVVVVDDGSTDATAQVVRSAMAAHPGRIVLEQQPNRGAGLARNRGIQRVSGTYLTFVDSDDYLSDDCIERLVGAAQAKDADIVCCGYRRVSPAGATLKTVACVPGSAWAPFTIQGPVGKLYRTSLVQANNLRFLDSTIIEDLYFTLQAHLCANREVCLNYLGYHWLYNEQSISNTQHRSSADVDFDYALNEVFDAGLRRGMPAQGIYAYYFVRLVAWFVSYTAAGDARATVQANLAHYQGWLDEHVPGWRHDQAIRLLRRNGDAPVSRAATWLLARHPRLFASWCLRGHKR